MRNNTYLLLAMILIVMLAIMNIAILAIVISKRTIIKKIATAILFFTLFESMQIILLMLNL